MPTIPLIDEASETLDLSYGSGLSQEYRTRRADFGDGYTQRAKRGLNSRPQKWRLSWNSISDEAAESLRLFFDEAAGVDIIEWAPYGQDQEVLLKWTANDWTSKPSGWLVQDCGVTLTQEYDL